MPPHTISPTSSSQGLGISYSTLSPPPNSTQPHGFTGMGINPRPTPSASSPQRSHGGPPSPVRATPPRQPQFALRPTHTRGQGSKGFASFSALPPTDAPPSYHPTSPVRRLPVAPGAQGDSLSSVGTSVSARKPIRKDSKESLSSQGGTGSSRGPRRSKSIDLLRRLSRNGHDTIGGERYVPLSGEDLDATHAEDQRVIPQDEGGMDSMYAPEEPVSPAVNLGPPVEVTPKPARRPLPRQPSSNTVHSHPESHFGHAQPAEQSGYYDSQIHSTVDQRTTEPIIPESPAQAQVGSPELSSASSHGFQSRAFPHPPSHPPRSATAFSDPTYHTSEYSRPQPAYMMPRSMSQPLNLQSVRESDRELLSARTSDMGHDKRVSQVSTGIHSKNAVLLSAESGGMMLAFSPGEGRWRQGEEICGTGTGLIPTPQIVPMPQMAEEDPDSELKARPWSESTMSQHGLLDFSRPRRSTRHESTDGPNPPFLRSHGRSNSDGAAILARQGTLFYPSTSNQRASQELGVMLGGRSRRLSANKVLSPPVLNGWEQAGGQVPDKVRLEAAKKRKARVEVDVVLEREAVVEGGEIRGRMEVRVTGGKRSEGLRIGGGKIRVVGFEEISSSSRHIFYHHPHPLPVFDPEAETNGPRTSLFASPPDGEGYRLAAEGSHAIPFRMRIPVNGGAKGSYTSPNGKGPCVRYVVVGSVKIHVPSTKKRSIAHFYRSIVVLPYLNPATLLAPSPEPIEARIQKGLGWSLGGEKGKVDIHIALGRRSWVSGQRMWCEVGITNNSNKKIKSLHLALLQTVQTFHPEPKLDTSDRRIKRASIAFNEDIGTPDADACQTSTMRRKVAEEVMEADFAEKGAGRVTGKGWWTGVDPGEAGHWDMSILVPPGMLSIRRTRLIEVLYNLRVTVNGSIYVDVPVTLINFLSIDPPPMPSDGPRLLSRPVTAEFPAVLNVAYGQMPYAEQVARRMQSRETMGSADPAKASSTTLHLDALLQAGRARAEAEGRTSEPDSAKVRPTSMMSEYTSEPLGNSTTNTPKRPGHARIKSFFSARSQETFDSGEMASSACHEEDNEADKALLAARRAQGRQRSLALINLEMHKAKEADDEVVKRAEAEAERIRGMTEDLMSPMDEEYKPLQTPAEIMLPIMADTSGEPTPRTLADESQMTVQEHESSHVATPTMTAEPFDLETQHEPPTPVIEDMGKANATANANEDPQVEVRTVEMVGEHVEQDKQDDQDEVGDQTILDELVSHHSHTVHDEHNHQSGLLSGDYGGYDYAEEVEEGDGDHDDSQLALPVYHDDMVEGRRVSLPRQLPQLNIDPRLSFGGFDVPDREAHIKATRSVNGSFAVSTMSENESEVGQVFEAVKRNVSIKSPSRLLPLKGSQPAQSSPPKRRDSNFGPAPNTSQGYLNVNSIASSRRPSLAPSVTPPKDREGSIGSRGSMSRRGSGIHGTGLGMRRESSNPPVPSPLRVNLPATAEMPDEPVSPSPARVIQKKPSFSFATPGSPLRVKTALPPRGSPISPGVSPRTATSAKLQQPKSASPAAEPMARLPSNGAPSSLRNIVKPRPISPSPSIDAEQAPGLAPSVASDSASSDGHLESPPVEQYAESITTPKSKMFGVRYDGFKHAAIDPAWRPENLVTQVNFLETDPNPQPVVRSRLSISRASSSDDHHSMTSHETTTSILPGVRNKIAQMESRQEALRKFSVASIAPISSPPRDPLPTIPMPVPFASPRIPSERKRYTSALASRPARQGSDDIDWQNTLGGTTYIRPRVYRQSMSPDAAFDGPLDPFGLGVKRNTSTSSTSTSATAIEAALGRKMGPRVYGSGAGIISPRQRDLPKIPSPPRVTEELMETDSSEGLL